MIIPEVLNHYNVYNGDGDKLIGITEEMTIAELTSKVATISGAGIPGSYEVPVLGHLEPITQEVPFRLLYSPVLTMANPLKPVRLNVRGAIQVTNKSTQISDLAGFRYVVGGRCKVISGGNLKSGDVMGSKLSIASTYVLFEVNGEKLIEVDVLNSVYRIDGVDLMERVRRLC